MAKLSTRHDTTILSFNADVPVKSRPEVRTSRVEVPEPASSENEDAVLSSLVSEEIIMLPLADLVVYENIRSTINQTAIDELASSIEQRGLLHPIRVFLDKNKYYIIYGQRRYLACKQLNFTNMPCIITTKPSTLDIIYQQIIENEQTQSLTSEEREQYVAKLHNELMQTPEQIAKKIGKSVNYIYTLLNANDFREKHGEKFKKAGADLTTHDTKVISSIDDETMDEALEALTLNPGDKTEILKQAKKKSDFKKGKTPKTAKPKNDYSEHFGIGDISPPLPPLESDVIDEDPDTVAAAGYAESPQFKHIKMAISVFVDSEHKQYKVQVENTGDEEDVELVDKIQEFLRGYYQDMYYNEVWRTINASKTI